MYISLYHDLHVEGILVGSLLPHSFNGEELDVAPTAVPLHSTRRPVFVEGRTHVRITATTYGVPASLTLLLEYSRDNGETWASANASVTFDGNGAHCGEWEQLPPDCYGDVVFRVVTSDEGGAACVVVNVAIQLR